MILFDDNKLSVMDQKDVEDLYKGIKDYIEFYSKYIYMDLKDIENMNKLIQIKLMLEQKKFEELGIAIKYTEYKEEYWEG